MAPASNEEQFKFLISCIRYSNNGKVDFGQVAKECRIVSKGAAAKRYERMMRAHGIASATASVKSVSNQTDNSEIRDYSSTSAYNSPSKKRKYAPYPDENGTADDDETIPNIKLDMVQVKEQSYVKEEDEYKQLSLNEATNLMQYYEPINHSAVYGGMQMLQSEKYSCGDYLGGKNRYAQPMAERYNLQNQNSTYCVHNTYNTADLKPELSPDNQGGCYQSMFPYESYGRGHSESPLIVE